MTHQFSEKQIRDTYALARERYASLGVDADAALAKLATIPISLHCWQGDDVGGFEATQRSAGRRAGGHGQLSRQSRAPRRSCGRTSIRRTA